MSSAIVAERKNNGTIYEETYKQVDYEMNHIWPDWKKEAYNELFAFTAHATRLEIKK